MPCEEHLPPDPVGKPLPLKLADCDPEGSLSVTVSVPVSEPEEVGVNVTLMVQLPCGETEVAQSLLWEKSWLTEICEILSAAVPELVRVTGKGALVDPTFSDPKTRLLAERLADGAVFGVELPPQPVSRHMRNRKHLF